MDGERGEGAARGAEEDRSRKRRKRGQLHPYKRGGYWWVRGTIGLRDRKFSVNESLGLPPDRLPEGRPPSAAREAIARIQAELTGRAVWGDDGTRTWAHAAAAYLDERRPAIEAKGWAVDPELRVIQAATRRLGTRPLAGIKSGDLAEFMTVAYPKAGPATVRRHLNTLGSVLHLAKRRDWLKTVPHVPRPPQQNRLVNEFLLPAEVNLLIGCADDHMKALLAELFGQGPRGGEPLSLLWEDCDLGERPAYLYRDTKNGEPRRLPMHRLVAEWLRWERARQARLYSRVPGGRVYVNSRGEPWHVPARKYGGILRKPFAKAARRAAAILRERDHEKRAVVVERATPHWGRHTFASLRRLAGQDRRTVQMLGGWKDQRSMDPYDHLDDEHLRAALELEITDVELARPPREAGMVERSGC